MLKTLILTRLKFMFSSMSGGNANKKNGAGKKLLIIFLLIYGFGALTVMFLGLYSSLCPVLKAADLMWFYFAVMGITTLSLCFIGSVFAAQMQIFEAKDNELLLAMPIPPSYILFSRLFILLLFNYAYTAMTSIPALIIYLINFGFSAGVLTAFIIQFITLPMFALALSCICGWFIALINSRMRSKNIIPIVLSMVFLGLYFFFIGRMNTLVSELITNSAKIAKGLKSVFIIYAYGESIASFNIPYLLLTAAIFVIPMVIVYAVLSATFIRIATKQRGLKKAVYKEKTMKQGNAVIALTKKELKHVFGNAAYFLNGAMSSIMLLIAAVMLIVKRADISGMLAQLPGAESMIMPLAAAAVIAVNSMSMISPASISLEGKTLWLIKSIPVKPGAILLSKALGQFTVSVVPTIIVSIVAAVLFPMSVADKLLLFTVPQIFNAFFALFGVFINLQLPKFDWISEVVVIKQGISSLISMLVNMAMTATLVMLYILLLISYINAVLYTALAGLLVLILSALILGYFYRGGTKRFRYLA